jgi:hypothetical protein
MLLVVQPTTLPVPVAGMCTACTEVSCQLSLLGLSFGLGMSRCVCMAMEGVW